MSEEFRLGQVLGHTRLKEEAQAVELSALDAEYRAALAALAALHEQEAAQLEGLAEATRTGALDPAATEAARNYLAHLETSIERQQRLVAAIAERVESSRAELLAIAREKRLLEKLEERHDDEIAAATARRERAASDELSAQRHQRLQRQRGEVA